MNKGLKSIIMKKIFLLIAAWTISFVGCEREMTHEEKIKKEFEVYVKETFHDPESYEFVEIGLNLNKKKKEFDSIHRPILIKLANKKGKSFSYEAYQKTSDSIAAVRKSKGIPDYTHSGYIKYRAKNSFGAKGLHTSYIETNYHSIKRVNNNDIFSYNGVDGKKIYYVSKSKNSTN